MSRLPDLDEFLEDDEGMPSDDWEWGHAFGKNAERERITRNIRDRVADLRSCCKDDNCQEFASLIESYIEEWTE